MPRLKRRKYEEGVEYISCRLCHRSFKAINYFHLVHKHHFDPEHPIAEYKRRYRLRVALSSESTQLRRRITEDRMERLGHRLSRTEVLRHLRTERTARRSMHAAQVIRRFSTLHRSAIRIFGSWPAAIRAAGIDPNLARGPWKWTSERIREVLRSRVRRRLPITYHRIARDLPGLLEAACLRHGSWRAAVQAANLGDELPPECRHWTREELFDLLRSVRKERETVTYQALARIKRPGLITPLRSIERHFGTLSRARQAAGLPAREWRSRIWTRSRVLEEIHSRVKKGQSVRTGSVQESAGGLMEAGRKYFGSWRAAAESAGAGHLLGKPLRRWTKKGILQKIRQAHRGEQSLAGCDFRKADPGFYKTVCRHFGSWVKAVQASGLGSRLPVPPRHWTREELMDLFRSTWRRTGRLSSEAIQKHKRPGYLGPIYSARKVFGSFPAAKRAAGLEHVPSYPVRKWTPEAVIAGLRDRARRGLPMNYSALERDCYPLLRALYARFGAISAAFRAARVKRGSPPPPSRKKRRA